MVMKEKYLDDASKLICSFYMQIKDLVLKSGTDIYEQINKSMLTLKKKNRGIVWLEPKGNSLKVYFTKGKYTSHHYIIFPDGWGGYPYIKINASNFDLKETKVLINQAISIIEGVVL